MDEKAIQKLAASLIKEIVMRVTESCGELSVVESKDAVSATDVMIFSSSLLKAAGLAVFELGLWESWGIGRMTNRLEER